MSSSITRSNPNAFIPIQLSFQPDSLQHLTSTGLYLSEQFSDEESWSEDDTPTPKTMQQWSDATLTGRSSFCSWGEDEGVLDRLNCETVGHMFDSIDRALYDNCPTGNEQVDSECKEWSRHFPHFRVAGVHLLDSMEDGTEIVDPLLTDESDLNNGTIRNEQHITNLSVTGHCLKPLPPPNITTGSPPFDNPGLHYEEIITSDGVVEEYFAYSDDLEEGKDSRRVTHHRCRHIPPVTPNECIRDTVFSIVFDQLWSEIANVLQPLLLKHQSLKKQHNTFSQDVLSPSNCIQVHNFYLPSNSELPPPTRTGHPLSLKRKPLSSGLLGPTPISHTTDLPSLQKVMTIKAVPLQQRIPSSSLPPSTNLLSTSGTGSMLFHDSFRPLLNFRQSAQTPLPSYNSDQKAVSGKIGNRRNPLKPIEISRTPAPMLEEDIKDFNGLIGQRLVRHTQLPPLDKSQLDSNKISRSSGVKGRVTFANRVVSAAVENNESTGRYFQRQVPGNPVESRPNTTQTFRSETPLIRKSSNHSIGILSSTSPIKIIGHAASIHNDLVLWEEQEEGASDTGQQSFTSPKQRSVLTRGKTTRNLVK